MTNNNKQHLTGIRGWLILPAISFVMTIPSLILELISWAKDVFADDNFDFILSGEVPYLFSFLIFEGSMNVLLLLAYFYLNYLFFSKNYKTPKFFICISLGNLAFLIADGIIAGIVFKESAFDFDTIKIIIRKGIGCLIWILYFLVSVRVKNTFVNGKPNNGTMDGKSSIVS